MDNEYNNKRIHPSFYQHDYHVLRRLYCVLERVVKKYFSSQRGVLLDYGCGSSPYKELFRPFVRKYIGADIGKNKQADILLKENLPIQLKDNSIDIILSTQVLEHVAKTEFYLREVYRLLKKGGFLLISTHGIWPYHPYPTDYYRWTRKGLEKVLRDNKFKCLEINPILGPFASVTQFTLLLIAERLINKGLLAKILLVVFSLVGSGIIWLEDKLYPATSTSDASLYIACAKKS